MYIIYVDLNCDNGEKGTKGTKMQEEEEGVRLFEFAFSLRKFIIVGEALADPPRDARLRSSASEDPARIWC